MKGNDFFMSKFKKIVLLLSMICFCGVALAETVNWYVDDNIYTTTTCEIGNDITLPATPQKKGYTFIGWRERTNRGTFSTWATVPTAVNLYNADSNGSTTPMASDYMVVADASDYAKELGNTIGNAIYGILNLSNGTINSNSIWNTSDYLYVLQNKEVTYSWYRQHGDQAGSGLTCFYNQNKEFISCRSGPGTRRAGNYSETFLTPYNTAYIKISYISSPYPPDINIRLYYSDSVGYPGTWRFVYDGTWATDGIAGWKPVAQVE